MKIEDIFNFFKSYPALFLNSELAVCYIAAVLVRRNSYGTELIQRLEFEYPGYRISDTVLYSALNFLREEGMVATYWKKVEGRGRPRRMLQIRPGAEEQVQELALLWQQYTRRDVNSTTTNSKLQSR